MLKIHCKWLGKLSVLVMAGVLAAPFVQAARFGLRSQDTIVDQSGRIITVTAPFQRIISLYGAHTENLFALGAGPAVIGVTRSEAEPFGKPAFSYRDDPERFLATQPDLVLIRPMIARGYPQLLKRLAQSQITVVSLQPNTIEEIFVYWRILGVLTGKSSQAEDMIRRFQGAVVAFRQLSQTVEHPKRVYFEAIHRRMKTFAPASMAIFALETAGGVNAAQDATQVRETNIAAYSKERILAQAGHIDVFLAQLGPMNQVTGDDIRLEPGFGAIKAVQQGQVYLIDEFTVSRPTMRLLEGIYTIGRALYPETYDQRARRILQEALQPASVITPQQG